MSQSVPTSIAAGEAESGLAAFGRLIDLGLLAASLHFCAATQDSDMTDMWTLPRLRASELKWIWKPARDDVLNNTAAWLASDNLF